MHSEEECTDELKKIPKTWKTSADGKMDIKLMITELSPQWRKAPWPSWEEAEKLEASLTETTIM